MANPAAAYMPSLLILDPELLARIDAYCTAEGEDPAEFAADAVKLALDEAGSRVGLCRDRSDARRRRRASRR